MKIEVLVSTMNQSNYDLLCDMNISSDCVIVNQCNKESIKIISHNSYQAKWINSSQKGLSRSRNLAIKNSSADICILADDDLIYTEDYHHNIIQAFEDNPSADVIAFKVEGINKKFKDYPIKKMRLNFITAMKISSVQIAFKRKSLIYNDIIFKEEFGSGSIFYAGEENILLSECLRKGLIIYYVPLKIADINLGDSTWFEGFNERYFITKGAAFTAMSLPLSIPLIFQFAIRKRKLFKDKMSTIQAIKVMLKGRQTYINDDY